MNRGQNGIVFWGNVEGWLAVIAVPEPGTALLLLAGMSALCFHRGR